MARDVGGIAATAGAIAAVVVGLVLIAPAGSTAPRVSPPATPTSVAPAGSTITTTTTSTTSTTTSTTSTTAPPDPTPPPTTAPSTTSTTTSTTTAPTTTAPSGALPRWVRASSAVTGPGGFVVLSGACAVATAGGPVTARVTQLDGAVTRDVVGTIGADGTWTLEWTAPSEDIGSYRFVVWCGAGALPDPYPEELVVTVSIVAVAEPPVPITTTTVPTVAQRPPLRPGGVRPPGVPQLPSTR